MKKDDLLLLPYKLLKRAESGKLPVRQAAAFVRAAVAIELEIMCPIRLQNLSEINIDTDFVPAVPGRARRCTSSSPASGPRTAKISNLSCQGSRWPSLICISQNIGMN